MDYASLIAPKGTPGSIAGWINYSDAILPLTDILYEAQAFIYDNARLRPMIDVKTATLAQGDISVALPARLLDSYRVLDPYQQKLAALDEVSLESRRARNTDGTWASGQPTAYAIYGEFLQFDLQADQALTYRVVGYYQPDFLGPTNLTNFLCTEYPHILRPACLAIAADFLNDDAKYNRYSQRLMALLQSARQSDDMAVMGMQSDPTSWR